MLLFPHLIAFLLLKINGNYFMAPPWSRIQRKTLRTRTRTNEKLNPHTCMTPGVGFECMPHWLEARVLTTASPPAATPFLNKVRIPTGVV